MKANFHKHLLGIYKALRARMDLINRSIGHNATQGSENEREVLRLLSDFLPHSYGLSNGMIIGTDGESSKQVDIILYDKTRPNYSHSAEGKLFLADHVICAIEVKTTFTGQSLEEALENIRSVKRLQLSARRWTESDGQEYFPVPPLGMIFFYSASEVGHARDIDGFFQTVKAAVDKVPLELQPDLLFSLEHAAIFYQSSIGARDAAKQIYGSYLLLNEEGRSIAFTRLTDDTKAVIDLAETQFGGADPPAIHIANSKDTSKMVVITGESLSVDPMIYRLGKIKGHIYPLDQFRAFLNFISLVERHCRMRKTNKAWIIEDYFGETWSNIIPHHQSG